jgi:hypothetical protein
MELPKHASWVHVARPIQFERYGQTMTLSPGDFLAHPVRMGLDHGEPDVAAWVFKTGAAEAEPSADAEDVRRWAEEGLLSFDES